MDDDVSAALDQIKDNLLEVMQEMIKQAQDDNTKTFEGVAKVTDGLTEKLTDLSTKLDETSRQVTAIQDYLRSLASTLLATPPGMPIAVSPPVW